MTIARFRHNSHQLAGSMEKQVLSTAAANGPPAPPHLVGCQQVDEAGARGRASAAGADASNPVTCSALQAGRQVSAAAVDKITELRRLSAGR